MKNERLYYVDWLRVLVILTLVLFHSALTYTGIGDIYIKSPIKDLRVLPFLFVSAPLDGFFMTLLFFLSGVGTYYALQYKSPDRYVSERFKKLIIPFVLGTVFLCPVQAYTKALYNGFSGDYIHFIPEFFSKKIVYYLGYAHLWFLMYLFIISVCCRPLFMKWLGNRDRLDKITSYLCRGKNILKPIGFICLAELLLRPFSGSQTIIGDWANDIVYPSIYIFGFVFASSVNIQERVSKLYSAAKPIVIICIPSYIFLYYMLALHGSGTILYGLICVAIKGIYECSAIIVLLETGRKYLNKKSVQLSYLNKASFTYYIFHFIPVSILTYLSMNMKINIYIKYVIVISLSYAFLFLLYEFIVRRLFIKANNRFLKQASS